VVSALARAATSSAPSPSATPRNCRPESAGERRSRDRGPDVTAVTVGG
jgi:hypothetical protein